MKKTAIIMLSVVILALAIITTAFASDDELIAQFGTVVLDGTKDSTYDKATEIKLETKTKGDPAATATARCAWDGEYMYVFYEVKDDTPSTKLYDTKPADLYRVDSVEFYIFLSELQGSFLISDVNAAQWTAPSPIEGANAFSGGGLHKTENENKAAFVSVKTEVGYNVEMKIPFGSQFAASANKFINVAFSVNDQMEETDTSGGHQVSSWDGMNQAYKNTSGYKLMRLNKEGVEYVPSETTELAFETRPYKEPEPLELPETTGKTVTKNESTTKVADTEASQGGCGAVIAGGVAAVAAVAAAAMAIRKKNKES